MAVAHMTVVDVLEFVELRIGICARSRCFSACTGQSNISGLLSRNALGENLQFINARLSVSRGVDGESNSLRADRSEALDIDPRMHRHAIRIDRRANLGQR